jgi:hypothetical protein
MDFQKKKNTYKPDILLRPNVSSISCPCYALAEILYQILSPLVGNTESFVKNSEQFMKLIQEINLQHEDCLLSFQVVSLLTNVPVEEALQVMRNKLNMEPSLQERLPLRDEVGWNYWTSVEEPRTSSLRINSISKKRV